MKSYQQDGSQLFAQYTPLVRHWSIIPVNIFLKYLLDNSYRRCDINWFIYKLAKKIAKQICAN